MINEKTLEFWRAQCSKGHDMPVEVARDLIRAYDMQTAVIDEAKVAVGPMVHTIRGYVEPNADAAIFLKTDGLGSQISPDFTYASVRMAYDWLAKNSGVTL